MKPQNVEARLCALEAADKMYKQHDERLRVLEIEVLKNVLIRLGQLIDKFEAPKNEGIYETPK